MGTDFIKHTDTGRQKYGKGNHAHERTNEGIQLQISVEDVSDTRIKNSRVQERIDSVFRILQRQHVQADFSFAQEEMHAKHYHRNNHRCDKNQQNETQLKSAIGKRRQNHRSHDGSENKEKRR